jgi:site-specific recombinase
MVSSTVVKKAQRLLMEKLGICRKQQRLSTRQLEEYAAMFASPLGKEQVAALTALFGLQCPDLDEDGLVALAGDHS